MKRFLLGCILISIVLLSSCSSENPVDQPTEGQYFRVQVANEQFTMLVTDPATIQQAIANFEGRNTMHPTGRILPGNGVYNEPWSWHFVPSTVRMADVSIEVCDGLPSYVNAHVDAFVAVGYCPWGARVVKVGR